MRFNIKCHVTRWDYDTMWQNVTDSKNVTYFEVDILRMTLNYMQKWKNITSK